MESDRNARRRELRAADPQKYRDQENKYRAANRERYNAKAQAWKKANPEKVRAINRKFNFDVTQEEWDAQFQAQDECCAICKTDHPGTDRHWATDHDHVTGRLRGILCHPCNKALGHVQDRPEVLRAAADYLDVFRNLWK